MVCAIVANTSLKAQARREPVSERLQGLYLVLQHHDLQMGSMARIDRCTMLCSFAPSAPRSAGSVS